MKKFSRVFYGIIEVRLSSILRIGGGEEENYGLIQDGEGNFILPSSAVAGVIRHYLEAQDPDLMEKMLGSLDEGESRVIFYDTILTNAHVEKRTGNRIDGITGTAADGALFDTWYLSAGASGIIRMQAYIEDDKEAYSSFQKIVNGIASNAIVFGARSGIGAGQFEVIRAACNVLDLSQKEDLKAYLKGIDWTKPESAFAMCHTQVSAEDTELTEKGLFELEAEAPDGILVGGGEISERYSRQDNAPDDFMMHHVINQQEIPYIPGSSIRGVLRNYAEAMASALGIDQERLKAVFGNTTTVQRGDNSGRQKGMIQCSDVNIFHAVPIVRDRIKIDRVLGSVMNHALMNQEVIFTEKNSSFTIQVRVLPELNKKDRDLACAIVYLALRDIGTGLVSIGSESSIGYGRLKGISLKVEGTKLLFKKNAQGRISLDASDASQVGEWLKSLEEERA